MDWDERVLPSIGNEVLKAVVAQYNAEQLLTQRDKVGAGRYCGWYCDCRRRQDGRAARWLGLRASRAGRGGGEGTHTSRASLPSQAAPAQRHGDGRPPAQLARMQPRALIAQRASEQ